MPAPGNPVSAPISLYDPTGKYKGSNQPNAGPRGAVNPVFGITGDSFAGNCKSSIGTSGTPTIVRSGGVVTVNFNTAHSQVTGDDIYVGNVWDSTGTLSFFGRFTVTRTGANTLTYLDSRPDAVGVWNGVAGRTSGFAAGEWESYLSWWAWFNFYAGGGLKLAANMSAGGAGVAEIATFDAQMLNNPITHLIDNSGINDINSLSADAIVAMKKARFAKYLSRGINCINLSLSPLGSTHTWFNAINNTKILDVNRQMMEYCAATPGMIYIDTYELIVEPMSATPGAAKPNMLLDTIHWGCAGANAVGALLYNKLASKLALSNPKTKSNADNYGYSNASKNLIDTAPWTSAAGGSKTGSTADVAGLTVATGLTVIAKGLGATCTGSPVARADGYGYDQQLTFTPANNGDSVEITCIINASRYAVGDWIKAFAELALSGIAGSTLLSCAAMLQVRDAAGSVISYSFTFSGSAASPAKFASSDFVGTIPFGNAIVHDVSGYAYTSLKLIFGGAGGPLNIKYGRHSAPKNS